MSNNKQSSVEWFIGEIIRHQMTFYGTSSMPLWIIEQAKAMRKEEIKEAWDNAAIDATYGNKFKNFEHYYNETFGGNNDQQ